MFIDLQVKYIYILCKLNNLWINYMKSELLHDLWSSPDNNRLVSKQFSFRLPVHIAAKINALGELYPQKNRTQIVADLLASALDALEKNLPHTFYEAPEYIQEEQAEAARHIGFEFNTIYELGGSRGKFRALSNSYYAEYEKELGNESPNKLYEYVYGSKEYIESVLK